MPNYFTAAPFSSFILVCLLGMFIVILVIYFKYESAHRTKNMDAIIAMNGIGFGFGMILAIMNMNTTMDNVTASPHRHH